MTLNGVMAVTLRYFTEFGKFTFAISSPDEFLVISSRTLLSILNNT